MSKNVRVALIVSLFTLVWFASGLFRNPALELKPEAARSEQTQVKAVWFDARSYASGIVARGRTEPHRVVILRAEVPGRVVAVPAARGQHVEQNDLICQLAQEDRQQRVSEAEAVVAEAQLRYQGALKLKDKGYQSDVAIAQAKAALESASANLKRRQLDLANTEIRAPFAAVVETREVEIGDYIDRNNNCAVLLEVSPLKAVAQVSEEQVQQIKLGGAAQVRLIDGDTVNGEISYISQQATDTTRTYAVEVTIPNESGRLRAGLTVELLIPGQEMQAHLLPSSLLSLSDDGGVGVRALTENHRVKYMPVQLVGDDERGVWVLGLPKRVLLITVGQEYVVNGETVSVTLESEAYTGLVNE